MYMVDAWFSVGESDLGWRQELIRSSDNDGVVALEFFWSLNCSLWLRWTLIALSFYKIESNVHIRFLFSTCYRFVMPKMSSRCLRVVEQ